MSAKAGTRTDSGAEVEPAAADRKLDTESYRDALNALMQGLALFDADRRLRFHNLRFIELMELPDDFVRLGMELDEIIAFNRDRGVRNHENPDEPLEELGGRILGRSDPFRAEIELPSGHVLALRYAPLPDGGFVNTYTRITSRSQAEKKASRNLELLQAVLDNMSDGVRVFDKDLKLVAYNEHAFEMMDMPKELRRLGISYESLVEYTRMRGDYSRDDTSDDMSMEARMARAREGRGRSSAQRLPDGRVVQKRRNPMPGGGFVSTYTDITKLKQTEDALQQKAQALEAALDELKRSNTELEQFAYVASHDLQEPLRMVASYCQLLARRLGDKLDDDGREFIGYAVDGAERMQRLINDLLLYSRVGTHAKEPAPVALDDVLELVQQNLKVALDESGGHITHAPLPVIIGDDVQMVQLFQNLISNGLKFRRDAAPEIHIGLTEEADRWGITVADNGIGMESAYFERVFQIFQRLHERGKYPGTGIGLAVCKKIVERLGGTISVTSEPDRGSTFTISLPKNGATI